jgi:methylmalonyl-CoA/ethylmalonyl-CoA epimerase
MRTLSAALIAAVPLAAQLPDIYRSVDRVTWVVDNIDRVALAWEKVGMIRIDMRSDVVLPVTFRGKAEKAQVRMASGWLGDLRVDWIQPMGGSNAFAEYEKKHHTGILSLVHRVPTAEALAQEKERLHGLGVAVLQSDEHITYFDTETEGKYALGLIVTPDAAPAEAAPDKRIMQFAFTAHDLKPVSEYWAKLGLGAMAFNKGNLSEVEYWGKPIAIEQGFGWQRGRKVVYEWLTPITTPNVFDDHMKARGEGIHHLAVTVPDMDKAIADWKATGLRIASTGRWGTKGQPGSGRFAYVDTEPIGGVTMELLWNFPRP